MPIPISHHPPLVHPRHRQGRRRLLLHCLHNVLQGRWATLRALPTFAQLSAATQAALAAAANRAPPFVHRGGRMVSALSYRAAGGQLISEEAAQLAEYEAAAGARQQQQGGGAQKRQRGGRPAAAAAPPAAAAAAPPPPVFNVTPEEAAASSLLGGYGSILCSKGGVA